MTVRCCDIKWHPVALKRKEERGTDIGDPPELHFPGANLDHRVQLAIDRDDFAPTAGLDVLDQEEPFRQVIEERKQRFGASTTRPPAIAPSICLLTRPCRCG
jgi:hypothetical protein